MRLTLRTLLAYLDRILDPQDARELEGKIRDSELANQLVRRIRKVLAQRQTEVLPLDAQGLGRDANGVAAYLDNTLSVDQIPEFERICLESDNHLAEVAACHQILTRVLGEPAEIPADLRHKIYQLRHDAGHTAERSPSTVAAETTATVPASQPTSQMLVGSETELRRIDIPRNVVAKSPAPRDEDEHWREAQDYLKRPRRRAWQSAGIAALIAFCLALAAFFGMGPLNENHPVARWWLAGNPQPAAGSVASESGEVADPGTELAVPDMPSPSDRLPIRDAEPQTVDGRNAVDERDSDPNLVAAPAVDQPLSEPSSVPVEPPTELPQDDHSPEWSEPVVAAEVAGDAATPPAELEGLADIGAEVTGDVEESIPADAIAGETTSPTDADLSAAASPVAASSVADADAADNPALPPGLATEFDLPEVVESDTVPLGNDDGTQPSVDAVANTGNSGSAPLPGPISVDAQDPPAILNPLGAAAPDSDSEPPPVPTPDAVLDDPVLDSPPDPTPPRVVDVGRFLDREQVLIKRDGSTNLWQRVPTGTRLQVGDVLLSLPTYRVPLVLASGMQVSLIGPAQLEVRDADQTGTPHFRLDYGRLLIATFAQTGITFGLDWAPDHSGTVTLGDTNTTLAIELRHAPLPGVDPLTAERHQLLHILVTSGRAEWQSADGSPPVQLSAGQRLSLIDALPAQLADLSTEPLWVDHRDARPRDAIAGKELASRLVEDRPITLLLREEAESRRPEVRSLAVCSLAYLGEPNPLLVALNDPDMKAYWPPQLETLQNVVSLSPELAAAVQTAVIQRHGEDNGPALMRMLASYSPVQLAESGASELVQNLDHSSADFRYLASELLKQITGQASSYRAHATERDPQRRSATLKWRRMLDAGEIVYRQVPEVVQLLHDGQSAPELDGN